MGIIDEIVKELRSRMTGIDANNPYLVGKKHELGSVITLLDAVNSTSKCPMCGENIVIKFSNTSNCLLAMCNDKECGYEIELNQVGY